MKVVSLPANHSHVLQCVGNVSVVTTPQANQLWSRANLAFLLGEFLLGAFLLGKFLLRASPLGTFFLVALRAYLLGLVSSLL